MNIEDYKCPKCGSSNIELKTNNQTGDVDVVMGSFSSPFYLLCSDCGHCWYLVDKNIYEKTNDKPKQRGRALFIFLFMFGLPLVAIILFIIFFLVKF